MAGDARRSMHEGDLAQPIEAGSTTNAPRAVIDCDIHNTPPSIETLFPYLDGHWCDYIQESNFGGPPTSDYPRGAPTSARPGSRPQNGAPAGSSLALVREQVLEPWATEVGILTCAYWVQSVRNEDLAVALASALNQWQMDAWLKPEPRLRGSLVVPSQSPAKAAEEIERWGSHPAFVQVLLPVRSYMPYGQRFYDPLYAAAVKHDLVIGIHYGGNSGHPPTPVGWPSTYLEEFAGMAQVFQAQVISLVCEGTFDRFPALRVALLESGFTWLPAMMWRIDKEWKGLRSNTPWVKRPPSDYIRDHIRLSIQPFDVAAQSHLEQVIDQLESDSMLTFATDYPHWHYDSDVEAWPFTLPESLNRNIWSGNARAFYRLGGSRPAQGLSNGGPNDT